MVGGQWAVGSIEDGANLTRNNRLAGRKCKAARATSRMNADMFTHGV